MSLIELVDNSRTDKNTVHAYLDLYQKLVEDKKDTAKNILEIGIGGGGSIQLWNDFFLKANIYSIDITNMNWVFEKLLPLDRVTLYTGLDAYDEKIFNSYFYKKNIKFDMILDDGAHTLETMIKFVELYSKILTDDGILIIEDIPDMNWTEILKQYTPEYLKKYIMVYDLRNKKKRFDDIVFVIDKTKQNNYYNINNNHLIFKNQDITNLDYLSKKYGLDKNISSGCHNYIPGYNSLFEDIRYEVRNMLEIGIGSVENGHMNGVICLGYKTGNSLKCWNEYFTNSKIYGIDIFAHPELNTDKITTFVADQSNASHLQNVIKNINSNLDVIIDDGSHIGEHQVYSFMFLNQYLTKNGIYVIEDIQPQNIDKFIDLSIFPKFYINYIKDKFDIKYFDTRHTNNRADDFMIAFIRK
jgi:hypothetical protein